jgi:hypothetical protein
MGTNELIRWETFRYIFDNAINVIPGRGRQRNPSSCRECCARYLPQHGGHTDGAEEKIGHVEHCDAVMQEIPLAAYYYTRRLCIVKLDNTCL